MQTNEMVQKNLVFLQTNDPQIIAYQLRDHANNDTWQQIIVIFNGAEVEKNVVLPAGIWKTALQKYQFKDYNTTCSGNVNAAPCSAVILYQE
jgi:pullulanase